MEIREIPKRNILVIGNGFDLHHNMKTRYSDYIGFMNELAKNNRNAQASLEDLFVDSLMPRDSCMKIYRDKGFPEEAIKKIWGTMGNSFVRYFMSYGVIVKGWIDFEILIKNITVDIEEIMNRLDAMQDGWNKYDKGIECSEREALLAKSFHKIFDLRNRNRACWIKKGFANDLTGINRKEVRKILRKEFDGLCESLWIYLKEIEPYCRECKSDITYRQIEEIKADTVITFNYTDTYKRYGISPKNVIHVHGSLAEDNIVLGFHDDNEEELQYVYFKKYMQRILKHTPILERYDLHVGIEDADTENSYFFADLIMHFFGHSLDVTDVDMLIYLFETASKIKIYYYDEDDHEEKIEKAIAMLGKERAVQRIHEGLIDFILIEKTEEEKIKEKTAKESD